MAVGSITAQVTGVVQSLLVLHLLDPKAYGLWAGLLLIVSYSAFSHLGAEYGFGLRAPYYKGMGDDAGQRRARDSLYALWTLITLAIFAPIIAYAMFHARRLPEMSWIGLVAVALLVLLQQQVAFFTRLHSVELRFKLLGLANLGYSLVGLVLIVSCVRFFGIYGLMAGALLMAGMNLAVLWMRSGYRFGWCISWPMILELVAIGLPFLLVGLGSRLIDTIDRAVVVLNLGTEQMGYYSILGIGGTVATSLLLQVSTVMSPHIPERFGRSHDDPRSLEAFLVRPTIAFALFGGFFVAVLTGLLPLVIRAYLPRYEAAINAVYYFMPGYFFVGAILNANMILNVILSKVGGQSIVIYIQAVVIVIEAGAALILVRVWRGLEGVALASTAAYALYGCTILILATRSVLGWTSKSRALLRDIGICFVYSLVMIATVRFAVGAVYGGTIVRHPLHVIGQIAAVTSWFTIGFVPLALGIDRAYGLSQALRQAFPR